jgi:nucleoside-diphosphate-sugar epimerase
VGPLLITGGSGFVGSRFIELMNSTHNLVCLDREPAKKAIFQQGPSVTRLPYPSDPDQLIALVTGLKPSAIVHLAADYQTEPSGASIRNGLGVNIVIPSLLLEAASYVKAKFLFAGTYWSQDTKEGKATATLYAAHKAAFAQVAEFYGTERGVAAREAVLYDVYGPRDPRPKLVPYLLRCATEGRTATLREPDSLVDLVFVDDVVAGLQEILGNARAGFESFALRTGATCSVMEVVDAVREVTDHSLAVEWTGERVKHRMLAGRSSRPSPSGWAPKTTLSDGLDECWRAMSTQLNEPWR